MSKYDRCTPDKVEQLEWLEHRGTDMLNTKIMLMNTEALIEWWRIGGHDSFFRTLMFVRPVDRMKYYRGQRMTCFDLVQMIARGQQMPRMMLVSPQQGLFSTWDVTIDNHTVMKVECTRQAYQSLQYDNPVMKIENAERESGPVSVLEVEKAAADLARGWLPDSSCVMQIARIHGKFKIVDFEPITK